MTAGATGRYLIGRSLPHDDMAKRTYTVKKQTRKIQPVPLKLNYIMPAAQTVGYIDLAKDVSMFARKFIRQGHMFGIANVRVTMAPAAVAATGSAVYVSTMQQNWCVSNAWHKSFAMWNKQQLEAMEESGSESALARFRDFKVYLEKQHQVIGNLDPVQLGPGSTVGPFPSPVVTGPSPLPGEWQYSQIVIPNDGAVGVTTNYSLTMHGADTASTKGMVLGYSESRSVPQSPDPVGPSVQTSWMQEMFDVGDNNQAVTSRAQDANDELPYDQLEYPGADVNLVDPENKAWCFNRSTVGVNQFNLGGMVAPCGLIKIDQLYADATSVTPLLIEIELLPGDSRGYLLGPMQDM